VHVEEVVDALTRFANNAIHQNVAEHGLTVSMRTVVDGRTARVTTNRVGEDALRAALENSLALATSQPEDPHLLPLPGKQKYRVLQRFIPATAKLTAEERARAVKRACELAERSGQVAAGNFRERAEPDGDEQLARPVRDVPANASGVFGDHAARRRRELGEANAADVRAIDPIALAQTASEKAARAQNPVELDHGRYTVILEPAAVLDLAGFLFYDFAATAVEDKRSCFSGRLGKTLFGKTSPSRTTSIIRSSWARHSTGKGCRANASCWWRKACSATWCTRGARRRRRVAIPRAMVSPCPTSMGKRR